MTLAMTALSTVTNTMGTHRNELSGLRTFVTADSAAREGVYQYLASADSGYDYAGTSEGEDWVSDEDEYSINNVLHSGISVDEDTSHWPFIYVVGDAHNTLTERKAQFSIQPSDVSLALKHAIYSQHELNISGGAEVTGSIYSGESIDIGSSAANIDGNAYAHDTINDPHDSIKEDKDVVENALHTDPPYVDIASYPASPSCSYTTTASNENVNIFPFIEHGCDIVHIVFVDKGSIDINDTGKGKGKKTDPVFEGVLVVEGEVSFNSNDEYHCLDDCDNPLVVYVAGNLTLTGGTFTGLVYVTGETTVGHGHPTIYGSLMSIGGVDGISVNGDLEVHYDSDIMGNWANIEGLDLTGNTPSITGWSQQ
jgi:hypothetical protein